MIKILKTVNRRVLIEAFEWVLYLLPFFDIIVIALETNSSTANLISKLGITEYEKKIICRQ